MTGANIDLCRWCNKVRDFNHTFTAGYCLDNDGSVIYEHRFEVTPPSPQPAPQEIENVRNAPTGDGMAAFVGGVLLSESKPAPQIEKLPLCDGICDCGGCPHFNSHDPWNMRGEPKPAPQNAWAKSDYTDAEIQSMAIRCDDAGRLAREVICWRQQAKPAPQTEQTEPRFKKITSLQMATIYGNGMNLYYAAKKVSDMFASGHNPTETQLNRLSGCLEEFEYHFTPSSIDAKDAKGTR